MELAKARGAKELGANRKSRPGGQILADALVAQGIDMGCCVPGESYLDVLDGLYGVRQKLKLITFRFEGGAVNMAEAYGELTGRPAAGVGDRRPRTWRFRSIRSSRIPRSRSVDGIWGQWIHIRPISRRARPRSGSNRGCRSSGSSIRRSSSFRRRGT